MQRFLMATAGLALSAGMGVADYTLTILHTNDFHDRFEPISKYDSGCGAEDNAEGKCFGGMARMVTAIEAAKARHDNYLLVDGGDQFQGTLFYQYYKGQTAAEFMNQLGYDAMAVGNHEFDDGPEALEEFAKLANFPVFDVERGSFSRACLGGRDREVGRAGKSGREDRDYRCDTDKQR